MSRLADVLSETQILEPRPEKFRMEQRLQRPTFVFNRRILREQSGHEMVLIGEPDEIQSGSFR